MPHPDTASQFGQLTECLAHEYGLIFSTGQADLLHNSCEIGIAETFRLFSNGGGPLTESIESPHLLGILQVVDLLGKTNDKRIDLQLEVGILFA